MISAPSPVRCVAIDWLELFCSESVGVDYSAQGYQRRGWMVEERGYGTKQMREVFTLMDAHGDPMIEVRRAPRGVDTGKKTVYQLGDCYIRLVNRYCYSENPVGLMLEFMEREKLYLKKIYRIDLCVDFSRFDRGDKPADVARRIAVHRYAKINQCGRYSHGLDTWSACLDDYFSWGAPKSMVSTKFYFKTKELKDTGMKKPWIVQRWLSAGLIDNPLSLTLNGHEVDVWRLEFSIKSSAKEWVVVSKKESEDGAAHYLEHSLDLYDSEDGIWTAIRNLIPHYFHFKHYEPNKRKSRCKDKVLFVFRPEEQQQKFRLISSSDLNRVRPYVTSEDEKALRQLSRAYLHVQNTEARQATAAAIEALRSSLMREYAPEQFYKFLWLMQGDETKAREACEDYDGF